MLGMLDEGTKVGKIRVGEELGYNDGNLEGAHNTYWDIYLQIERFRAGGGGRMESPAPPLQKKLLVLSENHKRQIDSKSPYYSFLIDTKTSWDHSSRFIANFPKSFRDKLHILQVYRLYSEISNLNFKAFLWTNT